MPDDTPNTSPDRAIYSVILGFILLAIVFGGILYLVSSNGGNSVDDERVSPTPFPTRSLDLTTPTPTIENEEKIPAENEQMEDDDTSANVTINMTASNFDFSTDSIKISQGATVTINLTSLEETHDLVIDGLNLSIDRVSEGETGSVTFVADQPGTYTYYCSVSNHRSLGMEGTLTIE